MISLAPLVATLLWVGAAIAARVVTDVQRCRRVVTAIAAASFVGAAVALGIESVVDATELMSTAESLQTLPTGFLHFAPVVTCLVGLLAVALGPTDSHPPATLSRISVLIATALGFLVIPHPASLALLWIISAFTVWRELRSLPGTSRTDRLFAAYHLPSAVCFVLGVTLFAFDAKFVGAILLALAIGIRESSLPVHSWFPRFVQRAPMGIVVAFAAPQLGVYAHFQLLSGGIPESLAPVLALVGAMTAVLAAALGVAQIDARRALAYLMISQTGLVAFGLESESGVAVAGAVLTWQVLALATSGFAMTLAALEGRRGRLSLSVPGGNFARTPRLAVGFLFLGLASVGFPLTAGFIAEDILVQGSIEGFPFLAVTLILATALNGMTVMKSFFLLFSGRVTHKGERDLGPRELSVTTLVILVLLVGGICPWAILG